MNMQEKSENNRKIWNNATLRAGGGQKTATGKTLLQPYSKSIF